MARRRASRVRLLRARFLRAVRPSLDGSRHPDLWRRPDRLRLFPGQRPPHRQLTGHEHFLPCVSSATLVTSDPPAGRVPITATFGGDVLFAASTSTVLTQIVNPDPTNVTITPSEASPEAGQPVTDAATVASTSQGSAKPTGSVSFTDDDSSVPSCQSLPLPDDSPVPGGLHRDVGIRGHAHHRGDRQRGRRQRRQLGLVAPDDRPAPDRDRRHVVHPEHRLRTGRPRDGHHHTRRQRRGLAANPSGSVTFFDGSLPLGTVDVSDAGSTSTASLGTSSMVEGPHFITADYSGDATYATSTTAHAGDGRRGRSAHDRHPQRPHPRKSEVVGQTVVLTASIASPAPGPTGTVQFADNGEPIGSEAVSGGQSTFATSSLALGGHAITAVYEGDDNFIGGSSTDTLMQTVGQAPTSTGCGPVRTTLAWSGSRSPTRSRVAVATPGSGKATGTVSFSDDGNPVPGCRGAHGSPAPPSVVTCTQADASSGTQDITVVYSGDTNFTASEALHDRERVAGVHHDHTRPVARHVDVGPERDTHRHREPDVGDGRPERRGVVQARRGNGARDLRGVDDERHQLRQHAAHDLGPRDGRRHRVRTAAAPTSSPVRPPARRPSTVTKASTTIGLLMVRCFPSPACRPR